VEQVVTEWELGRGYIELWNKVYRRIAAEAPGALDILNEEVDAARLPAVVPTDYCTACDGTGWDGHRHVCEACGGTGRESDRVEIEQIEEMIG
jgi:hypothetical protein